MADINNGSGADSLTQGQSIFRTLSRKLYPKNKDAMLEWAYELWLHHGIYSQAISKAVRYFMTEVEINAEEDISYSTKSKYKDALENKFGILPILSNIGDDYIAFGNSFTSVHVPFVRNLICPKCGFTARAKIMLSEKHAEYKDFTFKGVCPNTQCRSKVTFEVHDIRVPEETLIPCIIRWPPQYISIKSNPITGKKQYFVDFSRYDDLTTGLQQGDPLYVCDTPNEIIQAVKNNVKLVFNEDELYHMANETSAFAVPELKGWGLPKFMSEFETAILISMLDRYNETIISDFLIPFRVISPPAVGQQGGAVSGDPLLGYGMQNFASQAQTLLSRHRKNPTGWNFFPFPLQYQILGGEAKNLTPVELMEHMEARLLNSMGIPQEFYSGTVQGSAGPIIGFKMFERTWQHFATELNGWLSWFVAKVGSMYNWENVSACLVPVSMYEDPEIRAMKFELSASRIVSQTTALRAIGLSRTYERSRILEEEAEDNAGMEDQSLKEQKRQSNLQAVQIPPPGAQVMEAEAAAQAQAQGQAPPGGPAGAAPGAPPAAPGSAPGGATPMPPAPMGAPSGQPAAGPVSLDDLLAQSDQIANDLLYSDPYTRRSQLTDLRRSNEALWAQVKARLQTLEQQAAQYGLNMVRSGQLPMQ